MNCRDRFDGFLKRTPIDRVPVQLQNLILAAQATGRDFPVVCRNAELIASGHAIEWEKYRHDGVIVDIGTHAAAEALGCTVEYTPGELPRVSAVAIQEWDERRRLVIPDICNTPPLSAVVDAVRILRKNLGRHAVIIGTVDQGPFTLTTQIVGLEKTLLALAEGNADDAITDLTDFCTRFTLAFSKELAKAGADVVRMGDSIAGTDLISPEMYRTYALPSERRIAEELKQAGIVFDFHICGNATPIIHDMVATGAAYVEIDEKTDLRVARDAVRASGGINGPMSPRMLRFGTAREVEEACRAVLSQWMPQGGLFFGPGCSLVKDTPQENIRTLMDCARRYGAYTA